MEKRCVAQRKENEKLYFIWYTQRAAGILLIDHS